MRIITRKPQVFMLHFAGGNCYSFEFIRPYLGEVDVVPIELPGRGRRMKEKLVTDFEEAVEDLCRQVLYFLRTSAFVIYGHSLGAMLALRLTGKLEKMHKPPVHMIVSGNPGPGISDHSKTHTLSKEDFKDELKRMGGFSFEFFQVEDLFNFFEPILRADFRLAKWETVRAMPPVNVPIYALAGSDEEAAQHLNNWRRFTSSYFNAEILKGDHFFIHQHPQRIATIIKACLT